MVNPFYKWGKLAKFEGDSTIYENVAEMEPLLDILE